MFFKGWIFKGIPPRSVPAPTETSGEIPARLQWVEDKGLTHLWEVKA